MSNFLYRYWPVGVLALLAVAMAAIFLRVHAAGCRSELAARRQLFYRVCRTRGVVDSADLQRPDQRREVEALAWQYGLPNTGAGSLERILAEERSAYEARRRDS